MTGIEERRRRRQSTIPGLPECLLWEPPPAELDRTKLLMRGWQAGRCAACGIEGRPLVEDHDHDTGLTRGFLCRPCNSAEVRSGDLLWQWWRRGANPAQILGVRELYLNARGLTVIRGRPRSRPEEY